MNRSITILNDNAGVRIFDGVICFGGEDWWYHNRGHYDMQIMRRLARRMPVLYINSLGMRIPRPVEGRMFFTRVSRKLASIRRGLVTVERGLHVLSAPSLPSTCGLALTRGMILRRVRRAARQIGIRRPLIWVACPTAAALLEELRTGFCSPPLIYQRTDRYESFADVDVDQIATFDRELKSRSDCTVYCSPELFDLERSECGHAAFIDHGVDYDRFAGAAARATPPADLARLPHPRVGFIGGIDRHTFDPDLFRAVAERLPHVQFALVGACSLPPRAGWCVLPNVTLFGQRRYEDVADYMAGCDVLIMPWNRSSWIDACNPVKLREYLSIGKPIVSTPFPALERWRSLVQIASTPDTFAGAIEEVLREPIGCAAARIRQQSVQDHTWDARGDEVLEALHALGILPARSRTDQLHRPSPDCTVRYTAAPSLVRGVEV